MMRTILGRLDGASAARAAVAAAGAGGVVVEGPAPRLGVGVDVRGFVVQPGGAAAVEGAGDRVEAEPLAAGAFDVEADDALRRAVGLRGVGAHGGFAVEEAEG